VLDYAPWLVLDRMPSGYWEDSENRASATRWLVKITDKKPEELIGGDFMEYGLISIIGHLNGSTVAALREAGYRVRSIDMDNVPRCTWQSLSNVRKALIEIAEAENKRPEELKTSDIERYSNGILQAHGNSIKTLLRFAGLDDKHDSNEKT
jgi:hypothetical protein